MSAGYQKKVARLVQAAAQGHASYTECLRLVREHEQAYPEPCDKRLRALEILKANEGRWS